MLGGRLRERRRISFPYITRPFLQVARETENRKMDLFMYGFVKDFPQQLKSIQEANYALGCECVREISFNFISSFQLAVPLYIPERGKRERLMSRRTEPMMRRRRRLGRFHHRHFFFMSYFCCYQSTSLSSASSFS